MAKTKTLEQIAKEIFDEAIKEGEPVTETEALEMAKMEIGYTETPHYETTEKSLNKKSNRPKTYKVSVEKVELFDTILTNLNRVEGVERENIIVLKENKLIQVKIGEKIFKIDIIEQRKR